MPRTYQLPGTTIYNVPAEPCTSEEQRDDLQRELVALAQQGRVVLDCSAVHTVGASFLGLLVGVFNRANALPGDIVLCRLAPLPREVFRVTRVDTLLPIYPSLSEAVSRCVDVPVLVEAPAG